MSYTDQKGTVKVKGTELSLGSREFLALNSTLVIFDSENNRSGEHILRAGLGTKVLE